MPFRNFPDLKKTFEEFWVTVSNSVDAFPNYQRKHCKHVLMNIHHSLFEFQFISHLFLRRRWIVDDSHWSILNNFLRLEIPVSN